MGHVVKYVLFTFPVASAGLGVWQIKRLKWKKDLIANLEKCTLQEPIDLLEINSLKDLEDLEYRRVKTKGHFDLDPKHQMYLKPRQLIVNEEAVYRGRSAHQSNIGVNVITPFHVDGTNLRVLVNRGWLSARGPDNVKDNAHLDLESGGSRELVGVLRKSDKRPTFGIKNDQASNEWHIRDVEAMAQVLKAAAIFIDAEQNTDRKKGPIGGQTSLNVRNEHLNYAITWFSLSALCLVMWYSKYGKRSLLPDRSRRRT